jgi:hypothetical protein
VYRPLQFQKRRQDFFGSHDEMLPAATGVKNPYRSPLSIDR